MSITNANASSVHKTVLPLDASGVEKFSRSLKKAKQQEADKRQRARKAFGDAIERRQIKEMKERKHG